MHAAHRARSCCTPSDPLANTCFSPSLTQRSCFVHSSHRVPPAVCPVTLQACFTAKPKPCTVLPAHTLTTRRHQAAYLQAVRARTVVLLPEAASHRALLQYPRALLVRLRLSPFATVNTPPARPEAGGLPEEHARLPCSSLGWRSTRHDGARQVRLPLPGDWRCDSTVAARKRPEAVQAGHQPRVIRFFICLY